MSRKHFSFVGNLLTVVILAFSTFGVAPQAEGKPRKPCQYESSIPSLSGNAPLHLVEESCAPELSRILWRAFVSMVWPADLPPDARVPEKRGVPLDPKAGAKLLEEEGIRVWQTWKQDWELFAEDPTEWNSYEISQPPCDVVRVGDVDHEVQSGAGGNWAELLFKYGNGTLLNKLNKFEPDPSDEKFPFELVGPLVDKNKNFVFDEVRYNKEVYECITKQPVPKRCHRADEGERFQMPTTTMDIPGAIVARASWYQLSKEDRSYLANAHYVTKALLLDYEGEGQGARKVCKPREFALVGLAISLKSEYVRPTRPQTNRWIWGTFVADGDVAVCPEMKFSSGYQYAGYSARPQRPVCIEPLDKVERVPIDVCQLMRLERRVIRPNRQYKDALPSPWNAFSQLNFQWMHGTKPNPESKIFSHPILEVYSQNTRCSDCHNGTGVAEYDHIVSLAIEQERKKNSDWKKFSPYGSTWIPLGEANKPCESRYPETSGGSEK